MDEQEHPADLERTLVLKFAALKDEVATLNDALSDKKREFEAVEAQLMELLDDEGKKSSARFDGIGHVTCVDPTPYASIATGQDEILFESLRKMGRDDLIKLTVHSGSLTTLVKQCLKEGTPIPEGSTYYFKRRLSFYPIKK